MLIVLAYLLHTESQKDLVRIGFNAVCQFRPTNLQF